MFASNEKDHYINQLISRQRKRINKINLELEEIRKNKRPLNDNEDVSFREGNEKFVVENDNNLEEKQRSSANSEEEFRQEIRNNNHSNSRNIRELSAQQSSSFSKRLPDFKQINLNFDYKFNSSQTQLIQSPPKREFEDSEIVKVTNYREIKQNNDKPPTPQSENYTLMNNRFSNK
jgi:hypothetical protein